MAFARLSSIVAIALAASQVASAALTRRVTCATGQTTANAKCCALFPVVDFIQTNLFDGGECGEEAHSALRLAFHDAIGFSLHGGKGAGADGSILQFSAIETTFHANGGIDDITARQLPVWQGTNLTAGDFVHLAAAIGTGNCAGAPRLQFLFGRPPPVAAAPDLTVPEPTDSVTSILARFADAGFSTAEAVALLSSHTIAAADHVDTTIPGTPFDSTVATFDTQVFLEVLLKGSLFPGNGSQAGEVLSPLAGEMRLQSDFAISQDARTACLWQAMINDQTRMQTQFKAAMAKLQALGTRGLTDCSDVVPVPATFTGPIKFPASFSQKNVQVACHEARFPTLQTVAGPAPTVAPVPGLRLKICSSFYSCHLSYRL
ncbi:manganese peroxidase 1 [Pholiota molesta]|nr:manganese peroxidase 1 [Pholiota molesta]